MGSPKSEAASALRRLAHEGAAAHQRGLSGYIVIVGLTWADAMTLTVADLEPLRVQQLVELAERMRAEIVVCVEAVMMRAPDGRITMASVATMVPNGPQQVVSTENGRRIVCHRVRSAAYGRFCTAFKEHWRRTRS